MIIEGDENLGQKDIEVPAFLDKYVGCLFQFRGFKNDGEGWFSSVKSSKSSNTECAVYVDEQYLSLLLVSRLLSFCELVEIPGAVFSVPVQQVFTWTKPND